MKILKIAFFQKKQIFSKNPILRIFEDFQALLEKKLKVLWKKFPGQKMLKIIQKSHFLYLEVGKTTSRWIFWRKLKNQNFAFLKKISIFFSRTPVQALGIFFVFQFVTYRSSAFASFFSRLKIFKIGSSKSKRSRCIYGPKMHFMGNKKPPPLIFFTKINCVWFLINYNNLNWEIMHEWKFHTIFFFLMN